MLQPASVVPVMAGQGPAMPAAAEMSKPMFTQYLEILKRRKLLIGIVVAAFVMLALVITLLMEPVYSATTRIEISREQKNVTNVEGVESEQSGRDLEFYQTQYSLLEARSLAERVMRSLRLDGNEGFWSAHGVDPEALEEGLGTAGSPALARQARQKAAIELLLANAEISPIRGSALVDITYSSNSPEISAQIANAWASEFVGQSIARKFDSTADARGFLERRLAELRDRVEKSERDLVNYAAANNIITLSSERNEGSGQVRERTLAADTLESLNRSLGEATAQRIAAQARAGQRTTDVNALSSATLSQLRQQRAQAASEHAALMAQFERGYPAAQALENQVRELDRAIAREQGALRTGYTEEYRTALARENSLQERVNALSGTLNDQRRASIQYNIYQREADMNRQLYDSLLQRYKEIGVAGVSANNIAVIDRAEPPGFPSSPNLPLNLALAILLGTIAAIGLVFVLEQTDEGLNDPTRIQELLGLPLLGSVPLADLDSPLPEQIADPKSETSEAYLAIRSSLAFTTDHGVPRSIMVVSTQPAEGKSTSAIALATVFQRVGKKVILVDSDLRNPSLHKTLGLTRNEGVTNFLAGDDAYQEKIVTLPSGVDFLPAGPSVPSAAELLSSERMYQLIRELERHYDHVVVDSSPILGLADAPLLSRTVEGVIFVVQASGVAVRGLHTALARLRAANAPVLGVILTKFEDRRAAYGYGYGYGYRYGSQSDSEPEAA